MGKPEDVVDFLTSWRWAFAFAMSSKGFGNMGVRAVSRILEETIAVVNEFYRKII